MRFLADQDVYQITITLLGRLSHDVVAARSLGLSSATDLTLLLTAREQKRILVTRDRDFGGLVFAEGNRPGVIYLRISPSTQDAVHQELERLLALYTENELQSAFVVVEPSRHRIRRLE